MQNVKSQTYPYQTYKNYSCAVKDFNICKDGDKDDCKKDNGKSLGSFMAALFLKKDTESS